MSEIKQKRGYEQMIEERAQDEAAYIKKVKAEDDARNKLLDAEARAKAEEAKAEGDAMTFALAEAEAIAEGAKVEAKARAEEAKARAEEAKARAEEAKAKAEEIKAIASEARATAKEAKARAEEAKANARQAEANAEEARHMAEAEVRKDVRAEVRAKAEQDAKEKHKAKEDAKECAVKARQEYRIKLQAKAYEFGYMAENDRPRLLFVDTYEQYGEGVYHPLVGGIDIVISEVIALSYELDSDKKGRSDRFGAWLPEDLCRVILSEGRYAYTDRTSGLMIKALIEKPKREDLK